MPFSERDKLKALAIVHVFETSKPFGDYSALVVLKDGAGVSYGINQFTHRSGSLLAVVNTYLGEGGAVGRDTLERCLPTLSRNTKPAITKLSNDAEFKSALRAAGKTPTMHLAQQQIMENMYLLPAIGACEGSSFTLPLSLAVIYDSINHGSYDRIRDRVTVDRSQFTFEVEFERAWIAAYVGERNAWLANHRNPLLRGTTYRTKFFLHQIAKKNWSLDLPIFVHGIKLTDAMFTSSAAAPSSGTQVKPAVPADTPQSSPTPGGQTLPDVVEPTPPINPQTVKMAMPVFQRAWRWLGTLSITASFSTVWAAFSGLPAWQVFMLGFISAVAVIVLGILAYQYRRLVFGLLRDIVSNNADPSTNNTEVIK